MVHFRHFFTVMTEIKNKILSRELLKNVWISDKNANLTKWPYRPIPHCFKAFLKAQVSLLDHELVVAFAHKIVNK